jgi:hypothetical protein
MSHKKTWACIKPDGDGCDGNHIEEPKPAIKDHKFDTSEYIELTPYPADTKPREPRHIRDVFKEHEDEGFQWFNYNPNLSDMADELKELLASYDASINLLRRILESAAGRTNIFIHRDEQLFEDIRLKIREGNK